MQPRGRRCGRASWVISIQKGERGEAAVRQSLSFGVSAPARGAQLTPRTRLVLFNNPLNPAARVFGGDEVAALARVCVRHDLLAISDEVWEHVVFDARSHRSLLGAPGMAGRCVKIGSAGKMFGMTGWKIGFACAAPDLIEPIARAHQFMTFSSPPNLQSAVAVGLGWDAGRFEEMAAGLASARDRLATRLVGAGYVVTPSEGTYFLSLDLPASGLDIPDAEFCRLSVREFGVAAIPLSAVYGSDPERGYVRLCFAKAPDVVDAAAERLANCRNALLGQLRDASGDRTVAVERGSGT